MHALLKTLVIIPTLFIFSSFTNDGIREESYDSMVSDYTPIANQTYKEFIQDAYSFRLKNNMNVPDEYYEVLEIENPNTPAWVKAPATMPPPEPKLRDSIPLWVRAGILKTETKSYYKSDGTIKYVDKRRGRDGDIGPFQMRKDAFDDVKESGENFWNLEKNTGFAEEMACRYLLLIYNSTGNKNWNTTIARYNIGPYKSYITSKGSKYLKDVLVNYKKL